MIVKLIRWLNNKDALLVFLLLCLTYGFFYTPGGFNQNSRLGLTFSMVEQHSLSLNAANIENQDSPLLTGDYAVVNGRYYSDKAPGSSIAAAVVYYPIWQIEKVFHVKEDMPSMMHLLTFLVIGLFSAFSGALVYKFSKFLSKSRFTAFLVTIAIALGTISFPFSTTYFGHQLAASLLFISFYLIFQLKIQGKEQPISHFRTFLIGFLLGFAFLVEYETAIVILPLMVFYFVVLWQNGQFKKATNYLIPFLGGLLPILVVLFYNKVVFGSIFNIGYQFLADNHFKSGMSNGLFGITLPNFSVLFYETFHPAYGIFSLSPVLLMIFIGAFYMLRNKQYRLELALSFFVFLTYLLVNSGYYMWWGGNSLGPRAVIPMLPFLCIPLTFVPKKWYAVMIPLTIFSVFQMTMASASNFLVPADYIATVATDPLFSHSLLYGDCLVQLLAGHFSWNIGQNWFGLTGVFSLLPLVISQALIVLALFIKPAWFSRKSHETDINKHHHAAA